MLNNSPWIEQLEDINYDQLEKTVDAEVCVVGAGISGCLSAYYILENTQKSVILLDAWKVGQSASGHNAGQVINQFERSAKSIEKEFGTKKVIEARQVIEDSWTRLLEILDKIDLTPQPRIFKGYDAYNSVEQLNNILDDLVVYNKLGQRNFEKLYILKDIHIDHKYAGLYQRIELKKLKDYLDTQRDDFVGALERKTLIMNSALVCQKLIQFLLQVYPKRFRVFEKTEVIRIDLGLQNSFLKCNKGLVNCNKIVLCTNGFENFQINNKNGEDIIKSFHQNIIGKVGLMQGYFSFDYKEEIYSAVSYSPRKGNLKEYEEYIYTTKRRFGEGFLLTVGGTEMNLKEGYKYNRDVDYKADKYKNLEKFIITEYANLPKKVIKKYHWHGLMGYTKNMIRIVGVEPRNKNLLYNLGCNGVGLLPSVFGGWKISQIIGGKKVEKDIFDSV